MQKIIFAIFLITSTVFLWSQEVPPQAPTCNYDGDDPENCVAPAPSASHVEPTMYCTPENAPDGKKPCQCLHNQPNGCKEGKMDTEMRNCNSFCWKKYCHCCQSLNTNPTIDMIPNHRGFSAFETAVQAA